MYLSRTSKFIIAIIAFSLAELSFAERDYSVGECANLDSYIYYCKPFHCKEQLELVNSPIEHEFTVVGEDADNKCVYKRNTRVFYKKSIIPFDVFINCELSQEGKVEAVKEFQSYKKGQVSIYNKTNPNAVLMKECKTKVGPIPPQGKSKH